MKTSTKPEEIGKRIKARREQLCLTQSQLAGRINSDQAWLSRAEAGSSITVAALLRVCDALRIELSDLVGQ
jgi:transcriptional regulator with XRE-family HTH domain